MCRYARGVFRAGDGGPLRSAVADYQVVDDLGLGRYAARPPARLHTDGGPAPQRVTVAELAVGPTDWAETTSSLTRFASVQSPHLLRLLEVGPDMDPEGNGAYLVSEEVTGGTLAAPARSLALGDQVRAVAHAALGAHALHEAGIVHARIAPSTIFILERGAVLGPAGVSSPAGRVVVMRDWHDVALLDPDLLRGQPPSRSSDIWALAASLYAVAGSAPLYPAMTADKPVTAVQRVMFSRPEVSPDTPDDLAGVFLDCFDPDPAKRPQTASELADRLLACEAAR